MTGHGFDFHGLRLVARGSGALWWPEGRALVVADMHFGKSERLARRGGALLPPYEGLATLERLTAEILALDPALVVSLGDGFDDMAAAEGLDPAVRAGLSRLALGRDWLWVLGNHDPAPPPGLPGLALDELRFGVVVLRHAPGAGPDIAGHFHPVLRLAGERRRAFLLGRDHLILPAFGAYTGGLAVEDPALAGLVPQGLAIACGPRPLPVPLGAGRGGLRRQR